MLQQINIACFHILKTTHTLQIEWKTIKNTKKYIVNHCTLYNNVQTLYTWYIVVKVLCTPMYTIHCTLYTNVMYTVVHCTPMYYNIKCTVYHVHQCITIHTIQCIALFTYIYIICIVMNQLIIHLHTTIHNY